MREVTKLLVNDFKIRELGYDFMGYQVKRIESLSFHHLIVSHKHSRILGIGDGYLYWNGVALVQETSHNYLHLIEQADYQKFLYLTSEMLDMKNKKELDIYNLRRINEILQEFEYKNKNLRHKKGKILIKEEFIKGRMIK